MKHLSVEIFQDDVVSQSDPRVLKLWRRLSLAAGCSLSDVSMGSGFTGSRQFTGSAEYLPRYTALYRKDNGVLPSS
jgi:hypothetical protein